MTPCTPAGDLADARARNSVLARKLSQAFARPMTGTDCADVIVSELGARILHAKLLRNRSVVIVVAAAAERHVVRQDVETISAMNLSPVAGRSDDVVLQAPPATALACPAAFPAHTSVPCPVRRLRNSRSGHGHVLARSGCLRAGRKLRAYCPRFWESMHFAARAFRRPFL